MICHRHHEEEEGEAGQPEIPEGAVLQGTPSLGCGLEGDHAAEELGCDGPPASLQRSAQSVCMSESDQFITTL